MRVKLRVLEGSEKALEIPLKGPKFFIGRSKDCHLRPRSDLISRHHCVILIQGPYVGIRDFGSKNGTLVNGQRITGETELSASDQLTVGPLKFEVLVEGAVVAEPKSPVRDAVTGKQPGEDSVHTDEDIAGWLDEAESDEAVGSLSDTRGVLREDADLSDTAQIDKSELNEEDSASQRTDAPRKLPPPPAPKSKPSTSETQSAAAEMLRQFSQQWRDKRDGR
ncbi:MAG: FHA domain-containing protein [Planctomycetota bacterium]|nr:MAG: FHA domain-containing protein [Planctomycetota bacterium]REJ96857.1 MAG: FHA domain-containing protein [Planctomycetota bacterium]REK24046.1 MAG: FHA domain-containing protein [Planctomycetota bacterium]REK39377.1 MAG: FHA domain-containing protein [Planctomycetota bacterium]